MTIVKSLAKPNSAVLLTRFIRGDIAAIKRKARRFLTRDEVQYVAKEKYQMPDSTLCKKALDFVAEFAPGFVLNHCLRSHAFGKAIAERGQIEHDLEAFFISAVMHDIGLCEAHDGPDSFELQGAKVAHQFCLEHQVSEARAEIVQEAIALHSAVGIAHKRGPELALLHFGAGVDVAGLWGDEIHAKTIQQIVEQYPRLHFKQKFPELLEEQVARKPDCHIAGLVKLGFLKKIKETNLFDE